jgi:thymidylate kinase
MLISFSGIDGAGKSTQIQKFREYLSASGTAVTELTFWDNVAVIPRVRAGFSRRVLQSDGNVGTPEHPANRHDKNTQNVLLLVGRSILHLFDVINLRRIVRKAKSEKSGVVIFDRYIYDQLAALPMQSRWARRLASILLRVAPKPDLSYVLDADPEVARARKPEYPLEFMRKYRSSYLELRRLANLKLISPGSVDDVHQSIVDTFRNCMLERRQDSQLHSAVVA